MSKIKKGDTVIMSTSYKQELIKTNSNDHAIEFGGCEGVVEDRVFPDLTEEQAPEVNVRWKPSGLKYGYNPNKDLIKIS